MFFDELSVGGLLILIILSFASGLGLQAIGSYISSVSGRFSEHMDAVKAYLDEDQPQYSQECEHSSIIDKIRCRISNVLDAFSTRIDPHETGNGNEEGRRQHQSPIEVDDIDLDFYNKCRYEYRLPSDFTGWDRLFKLVLTDLEGRSHSRALRLQALYLGLRGMVVSISILGIYFMSLLIFDGPVEISENIIIILAVISLISAVLSFIRQKEFRNSVLKYIIAEFCILVDLPEEEYPVHLQPDRDDTI